jgi:hypothetical protein
MEKGKMMDWPTIGKVTITKMELTDKGGYRLEIKERPNTYYTSKSNELMNSMYRDYLTGKTIELGFEENPGGPAFRKIG